MDTLPTFTVICDQCGGSSIVSYYGLSDYTCYGCGCGHDLETRSGNGDRNDMINTFRPNAWIFDRYGRDNILDREWLQKKYPSYSIGTIRAIAIYPLPFLLGLSDKDIAKISLIGKKTVKEIHQFYDSYPNFESSNPPIDPIFADDEETTITADAAPR